MRNKTYFQIAAVCLVAVMAATGTRDDNDESSATCQDLAVTQAYCLESYSGCSSKPCHPIQLPPDATCFHANYLFCKHGIPDCCCGQHMVDLVECQIPNCKIDCEIVVQASSLEECTSEGLVLSSCLDSVDSGLGDCDREQCSDTTGRFGVPSEMTCDEMTDMICSADVPKCCCRQELIEEAECNFAKEHGVECKVKCTLDLEDQVSDGSEAVENDDVLKDTTLPPEDSVVPALARDDVSGASTVALTFEGYVGYVLGVALWFTLG